MRPLFLKSAMIAALTVGGASLATAQSYPVPEHLILRVNNGTIIEDTGVANRLVAGEVLRSLSQEIPAAVCHIHNGIGEGEAARILEEGVDLIDEMLTALLHGDIYWGILTPEQRRKTIAELEALRQDWAPIQEAGHRILNDPSDQAAAELTYASVDEMLEKTAKLLTTLSAQYSASAEILQRDVMFIHISGRMAALNQRLALEACMVWSDGADDAMVEDLNQSMEIYHNSLQALANGLPQMGISAPPTDGMADILHYISDTWRDSRPMLEEVIAADASTEQQRLDLYVSLVDERYALLDLVYLYQDHSKLGY